MKILIECLLKGSQEQSFSATVEQIITYALGEHDPGSAQNWRTSNDFCSPIVHNISKGFVESLCSSKGFKEILGSSMQTLHINFAKLYYIHFDILYQIYRV